MGSSKKTTVGYWYKMGVHAVLCHGPVDAVQSFTVGERRAWTGNVTSNTTVEVSQPELFGGEKREGGVVGCIDVMFGDEAQAKNNCLRAIRGEDIPAYRGMLSVVFRGLSLVWNSGWQLVGNYEGFTWSAMNPYLKPFWFTVRHIAAGRPWYTTKAAIGTYDMNPAHILWDVMTNTKYGLGIPTSKMDDAAFKAVADKLFTESFGISLEWKSSMSAWDFIQTVLDHITALLYVDPATGLFTAKLIRDDYVVDDLLTLDTSNITKFGSFERATWGEITNTIVLTYTNRVTGGKTDVTVHNLAAIRNQGGQVITSTVELLGICDQTLAQRIAQRDLRVFSTPLVKVSLEINRVGYSLRPGSVIKLNWPPLGISNMVMRVTNIEYGTLADGKIQVDLAEDVFGMPNTSYMGNQADLWVDPVGPPQPITKQRAMEASFFEVNRALPPSVIADYDQAFGFGKVLAAKPGGLSVGFNVLAAASAGGTYTDVGDGIFAPTATLASGVDRVVTKFPVSSLVDFSGVEIGTVGYVDNEAFSYEGYDDVDGTVVVKRGVLDTVPAEHSTGADIYFDVDQINVDETERLSGETVYYKLPTTNGYGAVDESLATAVNVTLNRRYQRPYPPGNLKFANKYFPAAVQGYADLALSWSHRDRVQQTVGLVGFTEGNIGPEAGTTYTLRIYGETGSLLKVETGISGNSYVFSDERTISGLGDLGPGESVVKNPSAASFNGFADFVNKHKNGSSFVCFYDGTRFVAATQEGAGYGDESFKYFLCTSTDGLSWTQKSAPNFNYTRTLYSAGVCLLISDGYYSTSATSDLNTWATTASDTNGSSNVIDGVFYIVRGDKLYSSSDGVTWTHSATFPLSTPTFSSWKLLGRASGRTFAMFTRYDPNEGGDKYSRLYYSTDNVSWTEVTSPSWADVRYASYAATNGTTIIFSTSKISDNSGIMFRSTDGINWSSYSHELCEPVYVGSNFFVTLSDTVKKSSDGASWTTHLSIAGVSTWQDGGYAGPRVFSGYFTNGSVELYNIRTTPEPYSASTHSRIYRTTNSGSAMRLTLPPEWAVESDATIAYKGSPTLKVSSLSETVDNGLGAEIAWSSEYAMSLSSSQLKITAAVRAAIGANNIGVLLTNDPTQARDGVGFMLDLLAQKAVVLSERAPFATPVDLPLTLASETWYQVELTLVQATASDTVTLTVYDEYGTQLGTTGAVTGVWKGGLEGSAGFFRLKGAGNYVVEATVKPFAYRLNKTLRVELESVRDGLTSMQKHDHTFERAGLGFSLGKYLGGV